MDKTKILGFMGDARFRMFLPILGILMLLSVSVLAQGEAGYAIGCMICRVMQIFYIIVGLLATLVVITGGIKWIGSGEDPEARTQAKSIVIHAIIGTIIVLVAGYVVSWLATSFGSINVADPLDALGGCTGPKLCGGVS